MKKKRKVLIICCLLPIFILIILYMYNLILRVSKEKEYLNLEGISYVYILITNKSGDKILIDDDEAIQKLTDYFNSLELVEETPNTLYNPDFGTTFIYIEGGSVGTIGLTNGYLTVWAPNVDDTVNKKYYIVDSEFNPINGSNKVSDFLNDLISKYASNDDITET